MAEDSAHKPSKAVRTTALAQARVRTEEIEKIPDPLDIPLGSNFPPLASLDEGTFRNGYRMWQAEYMRRKREKEKK